MANIKLFSSTYHKVTFPFHLSLYNSPSLLQSRKLPRTNCLSPCVANSDEYRRGKRRNDVGDGGWNNLVAGWHEMGLVRTASLRKECLSIGRIGWKSYFLRNCWIQVKSIFTLVLLRPLNNSCPTFFRTAMYNSPLQIAQHSMRDSSIRRRNPPWLCVLGLLREMKRRRRGLIWTQPEDNLALPF